MTPQTKERNSGNEQNIDQTAKQWAEGKFMAVEYGHDLSLGWPQRSVSIAFFPTGLMTSLRYKVLPDLKAVEGRMAEAVTSGQYICHEDDIRQTIECARKYGMN